MFSPQGTYVCSNSCRNWLKKITGMARSGILNQLEVRDFD